MGRSRFRPIFACNRGEEKGEKEVVKGEGEEVKEEEEEEVKEEGREVKGEEGAAVLAAIISAVAAGKTRPGRGRHGSR
jgi:hypothetical protein